MIENKDQWWGKSGFRSVVWGIPQGSVLGSSLFVVFLNDFSFSMPCDTALSVDDFRVTNILVQTSKTWYGNKILQWKWIIDGFKLIAKCKR